jgi:predicted kinase
VIVFCGVAGSGKSTLAAGLSTHSGLPHLNSDSVRKEMAEIAQNRRGPPELYTPEFTARTYRELAAATAAALESSGGVVLDATFHRKDQRALLHDVGARVLWIECTAPERVLRRRTAARERAPEHLARDGSPTVGMGAAGRRGRRRPPCATHRPAGRGVLVRRRFIHR